MTTILNNPVGSETEMDADQKTVAERQLRDALKLKSGKKVLIFGGYGTSNVGDDAILAGLLSTLPEGVRPTVVSMKPQETERIHKVRAVAPLRAPLELLSHNAVIIGGGGIFSGHMGQMSKLLPVMAMMARLTRKRVAFYGVGVYGSTPGWVKKSLRFALRKANLVTVRDTPSVDTLSELGVNHELKPDLATLLEPRPVPANSTLANSLKRENGRPMIGLCLTATDRTSGDEISRVIPEVIKSMPEADFVFIPMSQHPVINSHNDLKLAMEIQQNAPRMRILDGYHHPGAILQSIGKLDAAVCMRFHSMVFAEQMGTPIVPISYAEKTGSWLKERNIESVAIDSDSLVAAIRQARDMRRLGEAV